MNNPDEIDRAFKQVYYDASNPGSYGGLEKLVQATYAKLQGLISLKHLRRRAAEWLKTQDTYTLHKPIRRSFKRNATVVSGIDAQWQADLVDMQPWRTENRGYAYLLTCIDIFSKFAWVRPLKTKMGDEVAEALMSIIEDGKRSPHALQTDKGKEFFNSSVKRVLKHYRIVHFATENETKAAVVERFNRTLKSRMWRYFTEQDNNKYINVLQELVRGYNASQHRTIGMAPCDVKPEHEKALWQRMYGGDKASTSAEAFKFKEGDHVRLSKFKWHFDKGYLPNWTDEIFIVCKRIMSKPRRLYKLKDVEGEVINGNFYEDELQAVGNK